LKREARLFSGVLVDCADEAARQEDAWFDKVPARPAAELATLEWMRVDYGDRFSDVKLYGAPALSALAETLRKFHEDDVSRWSPEKRRLYTHYGRIIFDEIRRLRGLYPNIPMYAVVEDMCASGGYYIAAAADRIYVDKASIIGSIGVLMDGWGFTGTMEKLGVERRLLTAGENKAFMDPFSPVNAKHKEFAQNLLDEVHLQFIDVVKKGRGKRLKETPELFSGLMWTGAKSIELGLADGYGSLDFVAREVIKAEDIVDYTQKENIAERVAKRFGAAMASALAKVALPRDISLR